MAAQRQGRQKLLRYFKDILSLMETYNKRRTAYKKIMEQLADLRRMHENFRNDPQECENVGRYLVAVGFVEESVTFLREVMNNQTIEYLVRSISQPATDAMRCMSLIMIVFSQYSYYGPSEFCHRLAGCGFLKEVLDGLDHMKDLPDEVLVAGEAFIVFSGILTNCCRQPLVVVKIKEMKAVDRITPFLEKKEHDIRQTALYTLSYIVEDIHLRSISLTTYDLKYFLQHAEEGKTSNIRRSNKFSVEGILHCFLHFARNQRNRQLILKQGLDFLVSVLQTGRDKEKEYGVLTLTELARSREGLGAMQGDGVLMRTLNELQYHYTCPRLAVEAARLLEKANQKGSRRVPRKRKSEKTPTQACPTKMERLSQDAMQFVASRLGHEWRPVVLQLGLQKEQVEQIVETHYDAFNRTLTCLLKWRDLPVEYNSQPSGFRFADKMATEEIKIRQLLRVLRTEGIDKQELVMELSQKFNVAEETD